MGSLRHLSLLVQSFDPSQPEQFLRQSSPMCSPGILVLLPLLSPGITAPEDRTHFLFMWHRSLLWSVGGALVGARMSFLWYFISLFLSLSLSLSSFVCLFPVCSLSPPFCRACQVLHLEPACSPSLLWTSLGALHH